MSVFRTTGFHISRFVYHSSLAEGSYDDLCVCQTDIIYLEGLFQLLKFSETKSCSFHFCCEKGLFEEFLWLKHSYPNMHMCVKKHSE